MCKGPVVEGIKARSRVKEGWCDLGRVRCRILKGNQGGQQGPEHLEGMPSSFSEPWAAMQGCKDQHQRTA